MAKRRTHKYYIRIDEKIVSFERFPEFKNIDDLLFLSLFTGLFKDDDDLVHTLMDLGLVDDPEYSTIQIVRKSSPYSNEGYYLIASHPIYKDSVEYLSSGALNSFFGQNRRNYEMMSELLRNYLDDAKRLVSIFEDKIRKLELEIYYDPSNADLKLDLEKRKNSYRNFCAEEANISRILNIVQYFSEDKVGYNRDAELEYIVRIEDFVLSEANYIRGAKRTKNIRGCVKLALNIAEMHKKYPDIARGESKQYRSEQLSILRTLKNYLDGTFVPLSPKASKKSEEKPIEDDGEFVDPDAFMFLEPEDYERLLTQPRIVDNEDGTVSFIPAGEPSQEALESVETAIEELEFKQRRHGGK